MKKLLCVLVAFLFLAASSSTVFAEAEDIVNGMGKKLFMGAANTLTGWVEIPAQIAKGYNNGGIMGENNTGLVGVIGGVFSGIGSAVGRTLSGLGQLAGFWAADPESNDGVGIPLDADYAWEEGTSYDMMDPSFAEATITPIGKKLGRGIGNTLFGAAEFPGQIVKGVKEGAWDLGIIKGLWFWLSREVDGIWDLCTFPLPGPRENEGYPFDEKWPWSALGDSVK